MFPRPFRAARLRSYIIREHGAGRSLLDILRDPQVRESGNDGFRWSVLGDPRTLDALRRNDADDAARTSAELERQRERERSERQREPP